MSAAKHIPSRFDKNEKKNFDPLTYDDKVILDINAKLFQDRNAFLEPKQKDTPKKTTQLKPRKFNKHIVNHIES